MSASEFASDASQETVCLRVVGMRVASTTSAPIDAASAAKSGTGVILIDLICGGRLGNWYATLTSSTTGDTFPPSAATKVSRYWRNRAAGDATLMNSAAGASSLQA